MDDCISSRRGYFYLKTSISSLIRSLSLDWNSFIPTQGEWLELSYGAFAHSNYSSLWLYLRFLFWKQYHQHPFQEISIFEVDTAVERRIASRRWYHSPLATVRAQ